MNSKVCVFGDNHFGIKKLDDDFLDSQIKFFKLVLFPYMKTNGIDTIIINGDLFDNRTNINVRINNAVFDLFENHLTEFKIYLILGNHDIYFNSTLEVNSIKFLKKFDNVTLIEEIKEIEIKNKKLCFIPWQVDDNGLKNYIANNVIESKICFGHFDLKGFHLNKNQISDVGIDCGILFDNFKLVFSGHYHTRSKQSRNGSEIVYVGSPYQLTRNDIGEEKGFVVLDVETLKYEYVNNDVSIKYIVLTYPQTISKELIEGNIIDVIVKYDSNYSDGKFQEYLKKIEELNPISTPNVKIITENNETVIVDYKSLSTVELMQEYINNNANIKDKQTALSILNRIYQKCKSEI
jgi:DNA repair exonuclease SbcCD nuclease subunit